eukprot:1190663-Prorocentrum_minimum.AAC.1
MMGAAADAGIHPGGPAGDVLRLLGGRGGVDVGGVGPPPPHHRRGQPPGEAAGGAHRRRKLVKRKLVKLAALVHVSAASERAL